MVDPDSKPPEVPTPGAPPEASPPPAGGQSMDPARHQEVDGTKSEKPIVLTARGTPVKWTKNGKRWGRVCGQSQPPHKDGPTAGKVLGPRKGVQYCKSMVNGSGQVYPSMVPGLRLLSSQQRILIKLMCKRPDAPMSELLVKAGYSPTSHPEKTVQFRTVMQRLMAMRPDLQRSKLLDHLAEGLKAKRQIVVGSGGCAKLKESADHLTRHKFLETALKLNGDLSGQEDLSNTMQDKVSLAVIIMREREKRGLPPIMDAEIVDEPKEGETNADT